MTPYIITYIHERDLMIPFIRFLPVIDFFHQWCGQDSRFSQVTHVGRLAIRVFEPALQGLNTPQIHVSVWGRRRSHCVRHPCCWKAARTKSDGYFHKPDVCPLSQAMHIPNILGGSCGGDPPLNPRPLPPPGTLLLRKPHCSVHLLRLLHTGREVFILEIH